MLPRNRRATNGYYISSFGQTISMFSWICRRLRYIRWECAICLMLLSHLNIYQHSGLGNSMDYIVQGIAKSWTWLSDFHFSFLFKSGVYWCLIVNRSLLLIFSYQLCLTLCHPRDYSKPGSPVHHHLLEHAQTHAHRISDAIQPSRPPSSPSLLTSIFPSIRVFPNESVLHIRWPKN